MNDMNEQQTSEMQEQEQDQSRQLGTGASPFGGFGLATNESRLATINAQIAALQKSEVYNDPRHPQHGQAVDQMLALQEDAIAAEAESEGRRTDVMADPTAARPSAYDAVLPGHMPVEARRVWARTAAEAGVGSMELGALAREAMQYRNDTKVWTERETVAALSEEFDPQAAEEMIARATEYIETLGEGANVAKRFIIERRIAGPSLVKVLAKRQAERERARTKIAELHARLKNAGAFEQRAITEQIIALNRSLHE